MKKSIYKITNIVNNKIYIGQAKNVEHRFYEHINYKWYPNWEQKVLYRAFEKYGLDCFKFEIIENDIENYNEREKYWIAFYNCNMKKENGYGYNMTDGGEEPPLNIGEESPFLKHSKEDAEKVKQLLLANNYSCKEIAKITGYDVSAITRINFGHMWYDENLEYPLRKENDPEFKNERAKKIKDDLLNTRLTQSEIAKKYGVSRTMVTAINQGVNFHSDAISYPIRKQNCQKRSVIMIDPNTNEILEKFSSIRDAERFLGKPRGSSILLCLQNKLHTAYGYKWKENNI